MISRRSILPLALVLSAAAGWAQLPSSPLGLWRSVDDRSGASRALVRIFEREGVLYGQVEKIFDPKEAVANCEKCTDDRRGKPVQGLDIIRGLRPDGTGAWAGGEILDPETGDVYRLTMKISYDGSKLVLRGSIMRGLLGRSQTWLRVEPN